LKRNGHGNLRGEIDSISGKSESNLKFKDPIKEQIKWLRDQDHFVMYFEV